MNKFSRLLKKATQFAKMAQESGIRDHVSEGKGHLLEPNVLFRHVRNLKQNLLNAVGDVRSANQVLREKLEQEGSSQIEHAFSSTHGRVFIKACYDCFPDLDGAVETQDPRKLHLLKAENAVKSLAVVVNQLKQIREPSLANIISDLSLQYASAKNSLAEVYKFQQQKSKWNVGDVSNQDRAMLGVKDFYDPDEVKNPWDDEVGKINPSYIEDMNKKLQKERTLDQRVLDRISRKPNS